MAKLNLNFHEPTGHREPTKNEIYQIEGPALSVNGISLVMALLNSHASAISTSSIYSRILSIVLRPMNISASLSATSLPVQRIEYLSALTPLPGGENHQLKSICGSTRVSIGSPLMSMLLKYSPSKPFSPFGARSTSERKGRNTLSRMLQPWA